MRRTHMMLVVCLCLGGVLRLAGLGSLPRGFHADEASNGWNGWCLAETGADEHGARWPLLYARCFGDNRPPAYAWLAAASIRLFGPTVWAVRFPAAVAGIAAVGLGYVVARGFSGGGCGGGRAGAPWAEWVAMFMAVDPTLVRLSRWGHESSLTPALTLLAVAAWQWAGAFWTPDGGAPRRGWRVLAAGVVTGLACYAYGAIRIYLPVLAAGSLAANSGWARRHPRMAMVWAAGAVLVLLPLAWAHLNDPEINARARETWIGRDSPSAMVTCGRVALRYVEHFSPTFLFSRSGDAAAAPAPGTTYFPLAWAPLAALGAWSAWRGRRGAAGRFVILALLTYPVGDLLFADGGPNVLRCLAGWWAWSFASAWGLHGCVASAGSRASGWVVGLGLILVVLGNADVRSGGWVGDPVGIAARGADLQVAARYMRSRWRQADAVVFTTRGATFAYPAVLFELGMTPEEFRAGSPERGSDPSLPQPSPDLLLRCGNVFFDHGNAREAAELAAAVSAGSRRRSYFIVRPEEVGSLADGPMAAREVLSIAGPDGRPSLVVLQRDQ